MAVLKISIHMGSEQGTEADNTVIVPFLSVESLVSIPDWGAGNVFSIMLKRGHVSMEMLPYNTILSPFGNCSVGSSSCCPCTSALVYIVLTRWSSVSPAPGPAALAPSASPALSGRARPLRVLTLHAPHTPVLLQRVLFPT